jgi:probable rRNA maturation factor
MKTLLINNSEFRLQKKFIEDWLKSLAQKLKLPAKTEITVVYLDEGPARKLNLEFRKRDYATDILSFQPIVSPEVKVPTRKNTKKTIPPSLGELVLCPEVLERQAKAHRHSFKSELGYMLIHGVLHLLGYDHEGSGPKALAEAKKMYKLQDQLFESLTKKFKP